MNTNDIQAVATVTAVLLTGGGLWWEVRSRNRERRDAEAAQARTVVSQVKPRDTTGLDPRTLHSYEFVVTNHSAAPILDVYVRAYDWETDPARPARGTEAAEVSMGVLPPGGTLSGMGYVMPRQWSHNEPAPLCDVAVEVMFTDAAGLRWIRHTNDGPERWIDPTRPVWWVRAQYPLIDVRQWLGKRRRRTRAWVRLQRRHARVWVSRRHGRNR